MAAPSEAELAAARAAGAGRAALGPLPDGYPTPRLRLVLRDVNVRRWQSARKSRCCTVSHPSVRPLRNLHFRQPAALRCVSTCELLSISSNDRAWSRGDSERCECSLPRCREATQRPAQVTVALAREAGQSAPAAAGSSGRGGGAADVVEGSRLELDLTGLCLRVDDFGPGGQHARRVALSVHHIEVGLAPPAGLRRPRHSCDCRWGCAKRHTWSCNTG